MKKKLLTILFISTLVLSMSACGNKEVTDIPASETEIVTESTEPTEMIEVDTEVIETETEEVTEVTETTETTEMVEPTEVAEVTSEYNVTDLSTTKYAKSSVNVRKAPTSDSEKLGGLTTNQQVTVTGQADNGWYRIDYNGMVAFVSNKYLVDNKVNTSTNTTNTATTTTNTTTNTATNTGNNNIVAPSNSTPITNNTTTPTTNAATNPVETVPNTDTTPNTPNVETPSQPSQPEVPVTDVPSTPVDNGTGAIQAPGMTADELNAMMGGATAVGQPGGAENAGIGGDWYD